MMLDEGRHTSPRQPRPEVLDIAAFRALGFALHEDEAIWTREWICVGLEHDIPDVGDLLPHTIGDHAVHVQRMPGGALAGRFNKAQHGGCRVVPLQCQQGTKTPCSFTSCGHSRDREVIKADELGDATPEMYQYLGLRPERLLPVRVAQAGPLLFTHLDPGGEDLAEVSAALDLGMPDILSGDTQRLAEFRLEFSANWKLAGLYIAGIDRLTAQTGLLMAAGETRLGAGVGRAAWLFPNLVLLADGDALCAVQLQPTALNRTLCRVHVLSGDAGRWRSAIGARGIDAARNQSAVDAVVDLRDRRPMPLVTDPVSSFLCRAVTARLEARPMTGAAAGLAPFLT